MKITLSRNKALSWSSIAFIALLIVYGIFHYLARHPSTDDAYVQADTINIAAQVTGPVLNVFVKDHQVVTQGQPLFAIDPAPFQIAVEKANAAVDAQQAAFLLAEQNAGRIFRLVKIGQATKAAGDQAQSELDSAKATLLANQSQLAQAKLDLEHTEVCAPRAGIVTQFLLQPGNNVVANNTLFMLVEQDHFWVDANFKETQVSYIRPGQPAHIVLDMFPHHTFIGTVDAVSAASGATFSLLPPENASGNWVKVTQRFPIKVLIKNPDPAFPLRVGATATVTINTIKT